ncbi:dipicolinate synthase subunit DpsA [Paenibacillus sp. J5C_2022]|uniref:dipicolinate synthase subunit DpsA n=1 Tax=Paenibacillus sp. J5C2022 TaxID=2977129 RepID=UPI0021CDF73E|nr:dipicolinate synthase subunit DpsA [Paenibacillus sp. J5C2022]MCU6707157.1 dipicolinate synthase subunit DpsA [Paenibacillus sp. J5C2022]
MLTGVRVLLLGGDARQLEVIRKLCELDATVIVCGFDGLTTSLHGALQADYDEALFEEVDALLLPAVGTDDSGRIHAVFSDCEMILTEDHLSRLPKHCTVYTGMAKPYLRQLCNKRQLAIVELFDRDDVAIYNSIPTAEGALMMAIQHTDITIHGSSSMVLGFGRTGFTMARTLQGLGAKVKVGVRRSELYARAEEMGFEPIYIRDLLKHVSNIDLLFNTIPTMIVTAQIIANLPSRAVIIDLASKPGGTDFRFAEKRGIKAMLSPGLPGIVAPKTAGRIMAECLSQLIMDDTIKRGNGQ